MDFGAVTAAESLILVLSCEMDLRSVLIDLDNL